MNTQLSKRILGVALATALLLLVPLVAMNVTDDVRWSPADFVLAGSMLFATGVTLVLIVTKSVSRSYRMGAVLAVVSLLLLVWTNLAVGLIGSEDNPANLLYGGVLVAGAVGCMVSRLAASGMAKTLFVMAGVLVAAPILAAMTGMFPALSQGSLLAFAGGSMVFVVLFTVAGLLFRHASRSTPAAKRSAAHAG